MQKVYNSILDCIGNTPMVRLNRVTEGLKCTVFAKVEFFNPAGSIKDRVAKQIIEDCKSENITSNADKDQITKLKIKHLKVLLLKECQQE